MRLASLPPCSPGVVSLHFASNAAFMLGGIKQGDRTNTIRPLNGFFPVLMVLPIGVIAPTPVTTTRFRSKSVASSFSQLFTHKAEHRRY